MHILRQPDVGPPADTRYELHIRTPGAAVRVYSLDQPLCRVGRGQSNDCVLVDPSVSRRHAQLEWRGTAWWLVDVGSAHGTLLDGVRIGSAELLDGAEMRVGNTQIEFHRVPPGFTRYRD